MNAAQSRREAEAQHQVGGVREEDIIWLGEPAASFMCVCALGLDELKLSTQALLVRETGIFLSRYHFVCESFHAGCD